MTLSTEKNEQLLEKARTRLVQNYKQQPVVLNRGDGAWVWDVQGHKYLDMTAGIAVSCLGHAHPKLTAAIATQAARLVHTSNLYYNEQNVLLADALCARSFADRVFFCNSGGEANEAAIKLARRYQQVVARKPEKVVLVATEGSFHGRTVATVSLTGQEKYRKNFGPLFEPVRFFAYGDLDAAARVLRENPCAGVIIEPVQAEGGIITPPPGFMAGLKQLCVETGTMLIFDEVQTGIGRTGTLFGYEHDGVTPDVMTLAKGLAGGVPIGAMCATEEAAKGFVPLAGEPPPHASTFGGGPLASAAALAVLEVLESEALLANCLDAGEYLARGLAGLVEKHPAQATATRGRGLLRGLVVKADAAALVTRCREKGLLLSLAGGNVIRFAPPLIIRREDVDEAVRILDEALAERDPRPTPETAL